MNKQKFDEMYVDEHTAVHCEDKQDATEFLSLADSFGYEWGNGLSFIKNTQWHEYTASTCYCIKRGTFCRKGWYEERGNKVIKYERRPLSAEEIFWREVLYEAKKI